MLVPIVDLRLNFLLAATLEQACFFHIITTLGVVVYGLTEFQRKLSITVALLGRNLNVRFLRHFFVENYLFPEADIDRNFLARFPIGDSGIPNLLERAPFELGILRNN